MIELAKYFQKLKWWHYQILISVEKAFNKLIKFNSMKNPKTLFTLSKEKFKEINKQIEKQKAIRLKKDQELKILNENIIAYYETHSLNQTSKHFSVPFQVVRQVIATSGNRALLEKLKTRHNNKPKDKFTYSMNERSRKILTEADIEEDIKTKIYK